MHRPHAGRRVLTNQAASGGSAMASFPDSRLFETQQDVAWVTANGLITTSWDNEINPY